MFDIYLDSSQKLNSSNKTAVAIGKFDGVHRGHCRLLECLLEYKKLGMMTVALTFEHPLASYFSAKPAHVLTSNEEKRQILEEMGIDLFAVYPVNEYTMSIEPESFIRDVLKGTLNTAVIVAGSDLSFGKGGSGDIEFLKALSDKYDYKVVCAKKVLSKDGSEISSTLVRNAVEKGEMELARELMGRYYSHSGTVMHGKRLGRSIGVPTANIELSADKVSVPNGVYHTLVHIDGKVYQGISNIGVRPTVDDNGRINCETHIIDFSGDIYGKEITVDLCSFARAEMKFADVDRLKKQLLADIEVRRKKDYQSDIRG